MLSIITTPRLLSPLILAATLFLAIHPAIAEELNFGCGATVTIEPFGNIKEIQLKGATIASVGMLKGKIQGESHEMLQNYLFVPKNKSHLELNSSGAEATGVLLQKEGGAPFAEFTISYKKKSESALTVHIDLTYLTSCKLPGPMAFLIRFPVENFLGGTISVESQTGAESSCTIDENLLTLKSFGSERCVLSKDSTKVTVVAAEGSQINPGDARAWKDNSIWLEMSRRWKWAEYYSVTNGQKETIEFTIDFPADT